jgi:hypothetical protein
MRTVTGVEDTKLASRSDTSLGSEPATGSSTISKPASPL